MEPVAILKTIGEVSEMTRIPISTLRWYRNLGNKGPRSALLGGKVMYREQDVLKWIDDQFKEAND